MPTASARSDFHSISHRIQVPSTGFLFRSLFRGFIVDPEIGVRLAGAHAQAFAGIQA